MVSVLPGNARSPWDLIGAATGQQLGNVLPGAVQQGFNRGQLQQSLGNISNLAKSGASPLDITLATLQATAGIPGSERYVGQLLPMLQQMAAANASSKVGFGQDNVGQPRTHEPLEPVQQRQPLPEFIGQPNQNFPTNVGPQNAPGNLPQAATTGQVIPLRTPEQKRKDAIQGAKRSTAEGLFMTPKEYLEQFINPEEEDKKLHNLEVEKERKQRVGSQEEYGNKAVAEIKKIYPESTPEMDAIFQKKGEQVAGQGKSEAEINRYLATEAKNFKNAINNVKKDISAPRTQNELQRKFLGSSKDFNQASKDLRVKLKPILDLGLYDTARNLLTDLGYYPEERESIINPFSERLNTLMNQVPRSERKIIPEEISGPRTPSIQAPIQYGENDKENIKSGLLALKKADPNFDLVLSRKAFEDKNYDWRIFKDALNELEENGFQLTDDQSIQRTYLDTPPLTTIERLLHGLNLRGR